MRRSMILGLVLAAASTLASAQQSEVPLWLNLSSAQGLAQPDWSYRFTHRFQETSKNNSRDLYGVDGGAYTGFGVDFGLPSWPGANVQIYRTSDNKTLTIALFQQLVTQQDYKVAVRIERFDETVRDLHFTPGVREGIVGTSVQVPLSFTIGEFTALAVPTYLSSTSTQRKGLTTVGLGLRWDLSARSSLIGEYYPRPSKVKDVQVYVNQTTTRTLENGWAFGYAFKTAGHRFTVMATNSLGTTSNQVLAGDYLGVGPFKGQWALGFNLVRIF